jgi:biopolymer transport protein ExbB
MSAFFDYIFGDPVHLFFAVLLFGMSLTAGALLVWRILLNINAQTDLNAFLPRFQEVLSTEGIDGALNYCRAQAESEVIPRKLYVAGLENARQGLAAMRRAMANTVELEILPQLNFLLPTILAIAKIATMVGLLGTVVSMIGTFQALSETADKGAGQAQASKEIGLALFATAMGLLTAIPLVFAHVLFKAWVHKFEIKLKSAAQKLLLLVQNQRSAPATPAPAASAAPAPARAGAAPYPSSSAARRGYEDELRHG